MAQQAAKASDFDIRGAFGSWMAHLLKNIREAEPPLFSGDVLPGPPQNPAETAAALLERGDFDGLRAFTSNAFGKAAERVARMMPEAEYDAIPATPALPAASPPTRASSNSLSPATTRRTRASSRRRWVRSTPTTRWCR